MSRAQYPKCKCCGERHPTVENPKPNYEDISVNNDKKYWARRWLEDKNKYK